MRGLNNGRVAMSFVLLSLFIPMCVGEKLNVKVKIVDRQNHETRYTYVLPGHLAANSDTTMNCSGSTANVHCAGSTTTKGTSIPARSVSYEVRGATFSLLLPDGRLAIVNCEAKPNRGFRPLGAAIGEALSREETPSRNARSCRMPLVNEILVEFDGDKAKLQWPVSLDGKKIQSETYKILAVLDKP